MYVTHGSNHPSQEKPGIEMGYLRVKSVENLLVYWLTVSAYMED